MATLSNSERFEGPRDYVSPTVESMLAERNDSGFVGRHYTPTKAAPFKPSLTRAVEHELNVEILKNVAIVVIAKALEGDLKAVDLLWDRMDGKVPQGIVVDTDIHVHHSMPGPLPAPDEQECIEGVYKNVQDNSDTDVHPYNDKDDSDPFE